MLTVDDNLGRLERDLRQAILDGSLAPATRLMSVRAMAGQYGLSYGRALRALKKLEKQGLLVSRHGGGTFVAEGVSNKPAQPNLGLMNRGIVATLIAPKNFWTLGESAWFNGFIRGFESRIHSFGGSVDMITVDSFLTRENGPGPYVALSHVIIPQVRDALQALSADRKSVILVGSDPVHSSWALTMDIDGKIGIESALQHLFEFGHRKIVFAGWDYADDLKPHCEWWISERESAYAGMMKSKKLELAMIRVPHPALSAADDKDKTDAGIAALLETYSGASAIVCVNDALALTVLKYASRNGFKIPDNLSLVGFDDDAWTVSAGLTTLARPYRELGECSAGLVMQAASNPLFRLRGAFSIAPQLIKRNTVRAV
jgi:GntR family transcriptional regulator, arabinose operon transcriptional repressor